MDLVEDFDTQKSVQDIDDAARLPERVQALMTREATRQPQIRPYEITAPTEATAYLHMWRTACVDRIYSMARTLRLQGATPFIAVRLFDRYIAAVGPAHVFVPGTAAGMIVVACVSLIGKLIDGDSTHCGGKGSMAIYERYAAPEPSDIPFAVRSLAAEMHVAATVGYDLSEPSPHEYVAECTHWFDYFAAARGQRPRPIAEVVVSRCTQYLCNAFVHDPASLGYRAWEIAAAATFVATEAARKVPEASPLVPPTLTALWSKLPWSRGYHLCTLIRSAPGVLVSSRPTGGFVRFSATIQ
jgi:hypothetical protein